ncbi:S-adenosylmethionine:tRNA ribosyltransferase-isomerase [Luteipulveratus sp. YIM 133132]|uniref:S-adenosylmethionine:tRNA ribosyltransferase-isomerase n=1 Tax=Luteipulveratus flavus TaxID=3031728 RepID=UPI0023AEC0F6|nr:S-adenosylmethionine:tRNA ribosyltransferase-isomerase [Luteipulveratus sp. YIM 133132]MDE9366112.1 S-adenosylmethionine:tRNA ribosyltransferase-isomerase [Luteipulveratus sp. YIM 133132]
MTLLTDHPTTRFRSPDDTTAPAPAEARGLARDSVRLMVASSHGITHARFRDLPDHLAPGDLVVVNNSATIAGQVDGHRADHGPVVVHVATPLDDGSWVVELRSAPDAASPVLDAAPGEHVEVGRLVLTLLAPYPAEGSSPTGAGNRLWRVAVDGDLADTLAREGRPISYGYLDRHYPLSAYQSVFSTMPGSAEMPSAGRPFTDALVTRLIAGGVGVAPITLHTGVSSQDAGEAPQPERFEVPETTARLVNAARATGGRVIAVGTTVTRALESAVRPDGRVVATRGWTERVISPSDPARVVDGLITGWHNPEASHLLLVESIAGAGLTQAAYDAAVDEGYLWHEFGDSALLLP